MKRIILWVVVVLVVMVSTIGFLYVNTQLPLKGLVFSLGFNQFNGIDDFLKISNEEVSKIKDLEYGTIAFRFKFQNTNPGEILPIMFFGKPFNNLIIEIGHGTESDKRLYYTHFNESEGPVLCFDSNQDLEEDIWYHFVAINSPNGNTGYLNGEELVRRDYNFGSYRDTKFFKDKQENNFELGHGWFGIDKEFHFFKGAIDDFKIYNRVISKKEIEKLASKKPGN